MKALAGVVAMGFACWFLHHAYDHGSAWEGVAALCMGTAGALIALGAKL